MNQLVDAVLKIILANWPLSTVQTPSDSPWTEAADIKVDESNVLGYSVLDSLEQWAINVAPLLSINFDQATLFSGSVVKPRHIIIIIIIIIIQLHSAIRS